MAHSFQLAPCKSGCGELERLSSAGLSIVACDQYLESIRSPMSNCLGNGKSATVMCRIVFPVRHGRNMLLMHIKLQAAVCIGRDVCRSHMGVILERSGGEVRYVAAPSSVLRIDLPLMPTSVPRHSPFVSAFARLLGLCFAGRGHRYLRGVERQSRCATFCSPIDSRRLCS